MPFLLVYMMMPNEALPLEPVYASQIRLAAMIWHLRDLADPIEALALERLLNQGINSGNTASKHFQEAAMMNRTGGLSHSCAPLSRLYNLNQPR